MGKAKMIPVESKQDYQLQQAEKYRNRNNNSWRKRIDLAFNLMNRYILKDLQKGPQNTIVVDFGCSIGTFAIEFAKLGYQTFGVDFDHSALLIANKLADEENVSPKFICGDITEWLNSCPLQIDIAICFDIFEHLYDDEIGIFIQSIKRNLSRNGYIIFHTFPTQYEYIFFHPKMPLYYPLVPLRNIKASQFERLVKIYSLLVDIGCLIMKKKTYKDIIKNWPHCNPLTKERLKDIFLRSGLEIVYLDSSQLYQFKNNVQQMFSKQPISHRNIFGVLQAK